MNEKSLTVLEQYDLKINGTYRIKGNYGCDTDSGRYILQEYNNSNEKMAAMKVLYNHLEKNGFTTDYVVPNKDGNFVSVSEDGYTYILKKWFHAEECNVGNESHLLAGAKNLGRFHCCLENNRELLEEYRAFHPGKNMQDVFERHNKEIITIRNYIKKRKNDKEDLEKRREKISVLMKQGLKQKQIADLLGVAQNTISREKKKIMGN